MMRHQPFCVQFPSRPDTDDTTFRAARVLILAAAVLLSGCATQKFTREHIPAPLKVPGGHAVSMETVASGSMIFQCRANVNGVAFDWTLADIEASLKNRGGKVVGRFVGPPATWQASDGSLLTATPLATAPLINQPSAIQPSLPLALYQANPATGRGVMTAVTYIQQLATVGGTAPAGCDQTLLNKKYKVGFQSDFIFYKAN